VCHAKKKTVQHKNENTKMIAKPTHKARVRQARHTGKPFACLTHAFLPALIVFGLTVSTYGQVPVIETPKPATFNQIQIDNSPNQINNIPNANLYNGMTESQKQNQNLIRQIETDQRRTSYYQLQEMYADLNLNTISYKLPDLSSLKGTEYFQSALIELRKMLIGEIPLNLKKAVFIVENAYFENKLDYQQFENSIQQAVDICELSMIENKIETNDNFAKNLTIFNYMSDTVQVRLAGQEKTLTHYPIKYDFNDYMGNENWSNMFVSKLMATNSGQCNSMPLFYLILAQELGAESYMTYSPNHSFIRFKSTKGNWFNAELTCGAIITDAAILESGYVKTEAIRSGIYMDTLSTHETVASLINTLANGYTRKYGYDQFVKKCSDAVREYYPNQLNALMLESNWQTQTTMYIARQKGNPPAKEFVNDPKAKIEFEKMHKVYSQIDDLGYEFMPEEIYLKWLKGLEEAKNKPENQKSLIQQITR
jgi:hypothetical protein